MGTGHTRGNVVVHGLCTAMKARKINGMKGVKARKPCAGRWDTVADTVAQTVIYAVIKLKPRKII